MSRGPASIRQSAEWSRERCVHPPWHVEGEVCLLRPDSTLAGASPDRTIHWESEKLAGSVRILSPRSGGCVLGDHLLVAVEDVCLWLAGATGTTRWRRQPWRRGMHTVARANDHIYDYDVEDGSGVAFVFDVDLATGEEQRLFSRPRVGKPLVADTKRLVALEHHTCVGLDLSNGDELWSVSLERASGDPAVPGRVAGFPAVAGDLVVFGASGYGVISVRHAAGTVAWECAFDAGGTANLAVHQDHAHLLTSAAYTKIRLSDGAIVQREDLIGLLRPLGIGDVGRPAFHEDMIIAVGSQGTAFAYEPARNRLSWHADVGGQVPYACYPSVAHEKLWIMDVSGRLHVFDVGH